MNLVVLRLEGDQPLLDALVGQLSLQPDQTWRGGEPRARVGGVHLSSGLSATLAEASSPNEVGTVVRKFVERCKDSAVSFSAVRAELSIGVTVGNSEQYIAHVEFAPGDLAMLADTGLTLSISAYPTSDESHENQRAT